MVDRGARDLRVEKEGTEKVSFLSLEYGCTVWANSLLVMYVVVTVASTCY